MSITTTESLKKKAAIIREFILEKYHIKISQGHSLELISKIFNFKDWNTASATLKPKEKEYSSPTRIETVGDMKKALEAFDDSMIIDANYTFKLKEFEIDPDFDPESEIDQEFSFTLKERDVDMVSIELKLEHESIGWFN